MRKWHILGLFPPVFGMEQCLFCSVRCSNGNFGCLELILVGGGKFIMILQIEFDHSCFIAITKIGCESLKLYLLVAKKKSHLYKTVLLPLKFSVITFIYTVFWIWLGHVPDYFHASLPPCPNSDNALKWLSHSFQVRVNFWACSEITVNHTQTS